MAGREWLYGFEYGGNKDWDAATNAAQAIHWLSSQVLWPRDPALGFLPGGPPHVGGGWALRSPNNANTGQIPNSGASIIGAFQESFRFCLRRYPSAIAQFYSSVWGAVGLNTRILLVVDPPGTISVYNKDGAAAFPGTLLAGLPFSAASIGFPLDTWFRVRLLYGTCTNITHSNHVSGALFRIAPDGTQVPLIGFGPTDFAAGLVVAPGTVSGCFIGETLSRADNTLEMDVDDWWGDGDVASSGGCIDPISSDADGPIYTLRPVGPGFYSAWAGTPQAFPAFNPAFSRIDTAGIGPLLTSSTSGARHTFALGSLYSQGIVPAGVGLWPSAFRIAILFNSVAANACSAILRVNGVDHVYLLNASATLTKTILVDNPVNAPVIQPGDTLEIGVQKDATGTARTVAGIGIEVQISGGSYPSKAQLQAPLGTDIQVAYGRYTGNDTIQHIACGFAPDWIFVAKQSGTPAKGRVWWQGRMGCSGLDRSALSPEDLPRLTPTGFYLAGTSTECNGNTIVYQYIAIKDPSRRGLVLGSTYHSTADVVGGGFALSTMDSPAYPSGFVPAFQWIRHDRMSSTSPFAWGFLEAGGASVKFSGGVDSALASIAAVVAGTFKLGTQAMDTNLADGLGAAFCHWRFDAFTGKKRWNGATYVGNAVNGQTYPIDLSGQFPLFLLVLPHNGDQAAYRISARAVTESILADTGGSLAAGINSFARDAFNVGSNLNKSGITYSVFAIAADEFGTLPAAGAGPVTLTDPAFPGGASAAGCVSTIGPGADSGAIPGCVVGGGF